MIWAIWNLGLDDGEKMYYIKDVVVLWRSAEHPIPSHRLNFLRPIRGMKSTVGRGTKAFNGGRVVKTRLLVFGIRNLCCDTFYGGAITQSRPTYAPISGRRFVQRGLAVAKQLLCDID